MKINVLLLFLTVAQWSIGQSNELEYETLKSFNLKGKVKKCVETSFIGVKNNTEIIPTGKGWNGDIGADIEFHFDTLGNLVQEIELSDSGKILTYFIKLDDKNRIKAIHRKVASFFYSYDNSNKIISSTTIGIDIENVSQLTEKQILEQGTISKYY